MNMPDAVRIGRDPVRHTVREKHRIRSGCTMSQLYPAPAVLSPVEFVILFRYSAHGFPLCGTPRRVRQP